MEPLLIAVMGPTAGGKTAIAEATAERLGAQLINADAFQVYEGMDIGTAKPTDRDKYKLVDIRKPDESFSVGEFVKLALTELHDLYLAGRSAIVVGGTGLNIRALFEEYTDLGGPASEETRAELSALTAEQLAERLLRTAPSTAKTLDLKNPARVRRALERMATPCQPAQIKLPPFKKFKFAVERSADETNLRIESRIEKMMQTGWLQEVAKLRDLGYRLSDPGMRAIGYRHIWELLEAKIDYSSAAVACVQDTRRYAKRQRTWLRTEPSLIRLDPDVAIGEVLNRIDLG